MSEEKATSSEPVFAWADFLANHVPDKECRIDAIGKHMDSGPNYNLLTPDIRRYCEVCGFETSYICDDGQGQIQYNYPRNKFLEYECRNCQKDRVIYAIRVLWKYSKAVTRVHPPAASPQGAIIPPKSTHVPEVNVCTVTKLGELPHSSPKLPKHVYNLLSKDKQTLKLALKAEAFGMGIGAFAYYRRVVENSRTELFNELIKAAKEVDEAKPVIESLEADRDNWRFTDSVSNLKTILPESLNLYGSNPLALLHSALSHNLHNESDETCLEAAGDIRIVLTHMAGMLARIVDEQAPLREAVARLKQGKPPKDKGS